MSDNSFPIAVVGECDGRYLVVRSVQTAAVPPDALAVQVDLINKTIQKPYFLGGYLESGVWDELPPSDGESALQKILSVFGRDTVKQHVVDPLYFDQPKITSH